MVGSSKETPSRKARKKNSSAKASLRPKQNESKGGGLKKQELRPPPGHSSNLKNQNDVAGNKEASSKSKQLQYQHHQNIEEIYNNALYISSSSKHSRKHTLEKLEESGIIEKRLWPLLMKSVIARHVDDFDIDQDTDQYQSKYALLFALLVNRKAFSGSVSAGNSPLAFITKHKNDNNDYLNNTYNPQQKGAIEKIWDKEDKTKNESLQSKFEIEAFEILIHDVLLHLMKKETTVSISTSDPIQTYLDAECIQFLTHCYASIDVSPSISKMMLRLSALPLWEAMNPRRRVMELEQCPPLKLLWRRRKQDSTSEAQDDEGQKDLKPVGKKRKSTKASPIKKRKKTKEHDEGEIHSLTSFESKFIPFLVTKFLKILNELDEMNITYQEKSDIEDEDNDNSSTDNKTENESSNIKSAFPNATVTLLHTILVLFIDLLSIPATRRYLQPYLLSTNFTVYCSLCSFFTDSRDHDNATAPKLKLFQQLLQILIEVENFPMDNYSSKPLSNAEIQKQVHARCHALQQICFKHFISTENNNHDDSNGGDEERNYDVSPKILDLAYAGVAYACQEHFLVQHLGRLGTADLQKLNHILRLVENDDTLFLNFMNDEEKLRSFLLAVLVYRHAIRPSEAITLSQLPLYPSEDILWDGNILPDGKSYGMNTNSQQVLALPKLNTQFLTFGDYLLRSFKLMRLESAYGIRGDIVDAVRRSNPVAHRDYTQENLDENEYYGIVQDNNENIGNKGSSSTTSFKGWARMAMEIKNFTLTKIAKPKLGKTVPAEVLGNITIDLEPLGREIRKEWEEIGEFDNLFLVSIDASKMTGEQAPLINKWSDRRTSDEEDITFPLRYGIMAVRGCMVVEMRDEAGTLLNDPTVLWDNKDKESGELGKPKGTKRFIKVSLDPAQYAKDVSSGQSLSLYESFNLLVRRHGRENNFKAVLETIRDLMYTSTQGMTIHRTIPPWLHNVLLGYGDPTSARYSSPTMRAYAERTVGVTHPDAALDYGDTFLDKNHLIDSFPGYCLVIDEEEQGGNDDKEGDQQLRNNYRIKVIEKDNRIEAVSYPFLKEKVNGNPIRFTPIQVEAVRSGLSPGLTLIVGPPGTGKTDVAVQIIANLYHSFPTQRTVIVTHSNAALNDLFEKVMARGDIDERYLLRLGSGERDLQTSSLHDFTKLGRVAHILSRRGELLEKVQLLSESLGISGVSERGADGSPSYTCETAAYFNLHHIQKRIQIFYSNLSPDCKRDEAKFNVEIFPFKKYFAMHTSMNQISLKEAKDKIQLLNDIFTELAEYRPLELLRSQRQRSDYLLTKQARIVAMTCTHAAIARSHLMDLGFQYDNILMEEAGQMLEVETFIPMLLQKSVTEEESSFCRLKRICLIGDHHQLPPVVKNLAFSKYCHLDQSLFSRLIRLGVPSILLNKQGRARADIAQLYSWRYKGLGNLDHVDSSPLFQFANAGFLHNFQMINIEDFEGRGESTPSAYFYQNLGEAEYVVALFQYMVLIGYPPEKISILSTYNGQKKLIQDIVSQRCAPGTPLAGVQPGAIATVDQYQGQQNDFVLLSLVRTSSVGYLRDIRRLIVAVSRARLGLYVVGRQSLFEGCHELWGTMKYFSEKPTKLQIVTGEHFPSKRTSDSKVPSEQVYEVEDVADLGAIVFSMQEQLCTPNSELP